MNVPDLLTLFESLAPPTETAETLRFSAIPIPGYDTHRIGKTSQGAPSILLTVASPTDKLRPIPIVLEHLTIQYDANCRISHPDGSIEDTSFTVIQCAGGDQALYVYFLRVTSAIIAVLGTLPSQSVVNDAVQKLTELFRSVDAPPQKSIQGIWGELFLISRVKKPEVLLSAWHTIPQERYDFGQGSQRVEVKSTSGKTRQHHFSFEQLNPPPGIDLLVASIFIERSSAGVSALELADKIRAKIVGDAKLLLHLDRVVGLMLGENWHTSMSDTFDVQIAEQSLEFFEATIIPCINPVFPPEVSEIHFKSDLTGKPRADRLLFREKGGLFSALLKK